PPRTAAADGGRSEGLATAACNGPPRPRRGCSRFLGHHNRVETAVTADFMALARAVETRRTCSRVIPTHVGSESPRALSHSAFGQSAGRPPRYGGRTWQGKKKGRLSTPACRKRVM